MTKIKAFRLNVVDEKIEPIEIEKGSLDDLYQSIGNGCNVITAPFVFENGDTLYCDDEGLYHKINGGFLAADWKTPIVGNAIVVGSTEDGDDTNVKSTKEELEKLFRFLSPMELFMMARKLR